MPLGVIMPLMIHRLSNKHSSTKHVKLIFKLLVMGVPATSKAT